MGKRFTIVLTGVALLGLSCGKREPDLGPAPELPPVPLKLFPFCDDGKWGYINRQGEIVIKPRFGWAGDFADGRAHVHAEKADAFVDEQGRILFLLPGDWAVRAFSEGLAIFEVDGKCGYFDLHGKVVVEPQFDDARDFSEGFARVNVGAKVRFPGKLMGGDWGFIDKTGRWVVKPEEMEAIDDFSNGLGLVSLPKGKGYAYVDKTGKVVLPAEKEPNELKRYFSLAESFSGGLAYVSSHQGRGFIDKTGEFAIKPQFPWVRSFSEGLAAVTNDKKKVGYIDPAGNVLIAFHFDAGRRFSEGLAAVRVGKSWGYIGKRGKFVVDPRDNQGRPGPINEEKKFSGGLACVHIGGTYQRVEDAPRYWKGGAWYYINRKGEIVRLYCRDEEDRR